MCWIALATAIPTLKDFKNHPVSTGKALYAKNRSTSHTFHLPQIYSQNRSSGSLTTSSIKLCAFLEISKCEAQFLIGALAGSFFATTVHYCTVSQCKVSYLLQYLVPIVIGQIYSKDIVYSLLTTIPLLLVGYAVHPVPPTL